MKKTILFVVLCCFVLIGIVNAQGATTMEVFAGVSGSVENGNTKNVMSSKSWKKIERGEDKVIFRDSSGKVKKQIKLGVEKTKIKIQYGEKNNKKTYNGSKMTKKHAILSANEKRTVVSTDVQNVIDESEMPDKAEPEIIGGGLEMIDEDGNTIWATNFEKGRTAGGSDQLLISNNGVIAVQTYKVEGEEPILYVYNMKGEVILKLPTDDELKNNRTCDFGSEFKLSDDGKYLGITRDFYRKEPSLFFYNLKNGKSVNLGKDYGINSIDFKKMTAKVFIGNDYKTVDLKREIGE
jgi:hypothetical protein